MTVVIVVQPGGARAPVPFVADACLLSYVPKPSILLIMEQQAVIQAGDVEVVVTVIIVVADRDAHSIERDIQPCLYGDIGERAVAVIVIKRKCGVICAGRRVARLGIP